MAGLTAMDGGKTIAIILRMKRGLNVVWHLEDSLAQNVDTQTHLAICP